MSGVDFLVVKFGRFLRGQWLFLVLEASEHGQSATGHDRVYALGHFFEEPVCHEFAHETQRSAHVLDPFQVESAVELIGSCVHLVVAPRHHRHVQAARGHAAVLHVRVEREGAVDTHRHDTPPNRAIIDA